MKNKIALVVGSLSPIGTAICRHLCSKEAKVIAGLPEANNEVRTWQLEQRKLGFDLDIKSWDSSNLALCQQVVKEIESEYGELDILINNQPQTQQIITAALTGMKNRFYGRIINISTLNTIAEQQAYHQMTKRLAQEVAKRGITVNTIMPGTIESPEIMDLLDEQREKIIATIPVGRLGRPDEIARAVGFFASQTSGFITGTQLVIDGGQYLTAA